MIAWSPIARVDRWDDATQRDWRERGVLEVDERAHETDHAHVAGDPRRLRGQRRAARRPRRRVALRVPLLVVHGGRDESVPVDEGRLIAARAAESSLVILDRASHTFNAIHPLVHVPFELLTAAELSAHFVNAFA